MKPNLDNKSKHIILTSTQKQTSLVPLRTSYRLYESREISGWTKANSNSVRTLNNVQRYRHQKKQNKFNIVNGKSTGIISQQKHNSQKHIKLLNLNINLPLRESRTTNFQTLDTQSTLATPHQYLKTEESRQSSPKLDWDSPQKPEFTIDDAKMQQKEFSHNLRLEKISKFLQSSDLVSEQILQKVPNFVELFMDQTEDHELIRKLKSKYPQLKFDNYRILKQPKESQTSFELNYISPKGKLFIELFKSQSSARRNSISGFPQERKKSLLDIVMLSIMKGEVQTIEQMKKLIDKLLKSDFVQKKQTQAVIREAELHLNQRAGQFTFMEGQSRLGTRQTRTSTGQEGRTNTIEKHEDLSDYQINYDQDKSITLDQVLNAQKEQVETKVGYQDQNEASFIRQGQRINTMPFVRNQNPKLYFKQVNQNQEVANEIIYLDDLEQGFAPTVKDLGRIFIEDEDQSPQYKKTRRNSLIAITRESDDEEQEQQGKKQVEQPKEVVLDFKEIETLPPIDEIVKQNKNFTRSLRKRSQNQEQVINKQEPQKVQQPIPQQKQAAKKQKQGAKQFRKSSYQIGSDSSAESPTYWQPQAKWKPVSPKRKVYTKKHQAKVNRKKVTLNDVIQYFKKILYKQLYNKIPHYQIKITQQYASSESSPIQQIQQTKLKREQGFAQVAQQKLQEIRHIIPTDNFEGFQESIVEQEKSELSPQVQKEITQNTPTNLYIEVEVKGKLPNQYQKNVLQRQYTQQKISKQNSFTKQLSRKQTTQGPISNQQLKRSNQNKKLIIGQNAQSSFTKQFQLRRDKQAQKEQRVKEYIDFDGESESDISEISDEEINDDDIQQFLKRKQEDEYEQKRKKIEKMLRQNVIDKARELFGSDFDEDQLNNLSFDDSEFFKNIKIQDNSPTNLDINWNIRQFYNEFALFNMLFKNYYQQEEDCQDLIKSLTSRISGHTLDNFAFGQDIQNIIKYELDMQNDLATQKTKDDQDKLYMINVEALSLKQRFLAMSELLPNYQAIADLQKKIMYVVNAQRKHPSEQVKQDIDRIQLNRRKKLQRYASRAQGSNQIGGKPKKTFSNLDFASRQIKTAGGISQRQKYFEVDKELEYNDRIYCRIKNQHSLQNLKTQRFVTSSQRSIEKLSTRLRSVAKPRFFYP